MAGSNNNTGWNEYQNSSVFTGSIWWRVIGPFVFVQAMQITLVTDFNSGTNRAISSTGLLASYKPKITAITSGGNNVYFGQVIVDTNGTVQFYRPSGITWTTSMNISFSLFYMMA